MARRPREVIDVARRRRVEVVTFARRVADDRGRFGVPLVLEEDVEVLFAHPAELDALGHDTADMAGTNVVG